MPEKSRRLRTRTAPPGRPDTIAATTEPGMGGNGAAEVSVGGAAESVPPSDGNGNGNGHHEAAIVVSEDGSHLELPELDRNGNPNGNGSHRNGNGLLRNGSHRNGDGNGSDAHNGSDSIGAAAHKLNGAGDPGGSGKAVRLETFPDEGMVVRRLAPRPAAQQTNSRLRRRILMARVLLDLLAITGSLGLATALRFGPAPETPEPYAQWLPLWLALWWGGLLAAGLYDRLKTENPAEELRRILHGVTLGALTVVVFSFSTGFHLSRPWLAIALATAVVTVTAGRFVMRKVLHRLRRRGLMRRRALVVGADRSGKALATSVAMAPWEGIDVLGYIAVNGQTGEGLTSNDIILGSVDRLKELTRNLQISEVLVAPTVALNGHLSDVVAAIDGIAVDLRVATGLEGFLTSRLTFQPLGDRPLVSVERNELRPSGRLLKRLLDVVLAGGLIVATAPVMAVAALLIKRDSKGPVFFRQKRVGIDGEEFNIWKLRSMVADAEEIKKVLAEQNEADGLLFKMTNDPRITKVGAILRKTCIDELPQLFNVLAGHMSLVGPRPPLPEEVALYDKRIGRRLLVRPGLTGLWQINGRHELAFEDYIRFDLLYVQNWSLALDLYILAKTLPAVVAGRGAS
jgi:exopolysaccharide biosynthesis polyprenyl glycosylphosphotransferase